MRDEPRHHRAPSRRDPLEQRQLTRSRDDRVIAGVCAGLAEYTHVPVGVVRVFAVLLALWATPFPVIVAYLVASQVLPEEDGANRLGVDWQPNSMRVVWKGAMTPYVVSWTRIIQSAAVVVAFATIATALSALTLPPADLAFSMFVPAPLLPLVAVALVFLLVPRTYALTLSESALWIERPGTRARRIELRDIEGFHPTSQPFTIHLKDGTLVEMAPPPDGPELDVVVDELQRSLTRLEDHEATLEASASERERLDRVARSARAERQSRGDPEGGP